MTRYADLPGRAGAPPASSWGLWGEQDRLGTLNRLTAERVLAARASIRTGEVVPLDLAPGELDPPLFGRSPGSHRAVPLGPQGAAFDDVISDWNTQASSQWDGFGHVAEPGVGRYNGLAAGEHSVSAWGRHGVVGRGLLVDLPRWWAARGVSREPFEYATIGPDELRAALDAQGTAPLPGDILLIRTGWLAAYRSLGAEQRASLAATGSLASIGLAAGPATAEFLWDLEIAAVAADNPSLEAWPPPATAAPGQPSSLHRALLARLGVPIGELWDLDRLAERCATRSGHDFLCVSVPLSLPGLVASPGNAVAIL